LRWETHVKLKVWVEVLRPDRLVEGVVEVPDEQWTAMTDLQREHLKRDVFEDMLGEVVSGGCEEVGEEVDEP
jgi:hypothetical protein